MVKTSLPMEICWPAFSVCDGSGASLSSGRTSGVGSAGLSLCLGASLSWYELVGLWGSGCTGASELFAGLAVDSPPTSCREGPGAGVGLGALFWHLIHPSLVKWVYVEAYVVDRNVLCGFDAKGK